SGLPMKACRRICGAPSLAGVADASARLLAASLLGIVAAGRSDDVPFLVVTRFVGGAVVQRGLLAELRQHAGDGIAVMASAQLLVEVVLRWHGQPPVHGNGPDLLLSVASRTHRHDVEVDIALAAL